MQARRTLKIDNLPIDTEPAVLTLFLQHFLAEDLTKSMTNVHTVRIGDRFAVGYATLASCADVHKVSNSFLKSYTPQSHGCSPLSAPFAYGAPRLGFAQ